MSAMASQLVGILVVCSTVCSGANQRKRQSSAPLSFVRRIHWWPMNSSHKGPVTRKMFPFDDVSISFEDRGTRRFHLVDMPLYCSRHDYMPLHRTTIRVKCILSDMIYYQLMGWEFMITYRQNEYTPLPHFSKKNMMTSSNGNIFRVTGPLWGKFTGHRGIPFTEASYVGLWYFLWYTPGQMVK